ncbi:MAG: hypothetical protein IMZ57_12155 [Acidobacteria bacterium]|nr:hypothetical protein [Acidobacteriota bacterium]MBE3126392.1 hypothetical protein [Acidobacteriota bacterium]
MKALSRDTHIQAEKILIRLLREAPVYKHIEIVSSLIKTARRLSWQGIQERFPLETPRAHASRFLSLLYPDLPRADRILACLPPEWGD